MKKKILLMYISDDSGHHRASLAIEKALHLEDSDVETSNVNSFNYTNPILEKIINRTYMSVIKNRPEFWGYLYDNPRIVKKTQKLRDSIHKHNTEKLKRLLGIYSPDAIICTQAFPCGMIADFKKNSGVKVALFGVLTDYAPHSYWVFDNVDAYFVPSEETGKRLISNGVSPSRIVDSGIPVDPVFKSSKGRSAIIKNMGLSADSPIVLLMGGSLGIGPLKETFASLLRARSDFQIIAVLGKNKSYYRWFKRRERKSRKKLLALPFVANTDELMEISSLLISKPGGITTAEAFIKGLPLCIIKPIPGQEQMNTDYLLGNNLAIKLDNPADAGIMVDELFYNRDKLTELSARSMLVSKPDSAKVIAKTVLNFIR